MRILAAALILALAVAAWLLMSNQEPAPAGDSGAGIDRQAVEPRAGAAAAAPAAAAPPVAADPARQEAIRLNERALALLQQDDATGAEKLLVQACALAPADGVLSANLSRTRVRLGRRAEDAGRAAEALDWYRAAAAADADEGVPADWEAHFQLRRGERAEAKRVVLAALRSFPAAPGLLRLRGEIAFLEGDLGGAVEAYSAASRTDDSEATRARLAQLEEEQRVFSHYLTDATAHCDSRYDPEDPQVVALVPALHAELELAWQQVVSLLGVQPQDRLLVLWLSPQRYLGAAPEWSSGLYDGRVRVLVRAERGVDELLRATLRHELTHAVLHTLGGRLPTWLHEGLAQRSEGRGAEPARARLRGHALTVDADALAADWTAWTDADRLAEAYGLALSFVAWIEERYGSGAIQNLLSGLRESDFDAAWIRVFARSLAELEAEHRLWLLRGS